MKAGLVGRQLTFEELIEEMVAKAPAKDLPDAPAGKRAERAPPKRNPGEVLPAVTPLV